MVVSAIEKEKALVGAFSVISFKLSKGWFEALVTNSSKHHTAQHTHQQVEGQLELLEDGYEVRGSVLPQHLRQALRAAGHGAGVAQLLQQHSALLRTLAAKLWPGQRVRMRSLRNINNPITITNTKSTPVPLFLNT